MSEHKTIKKTKSLLTNHSLKEDFKKIGLKPGMTVIVHSSLSSIGWVCGAQITVAQALMETVTADGTVVMPAQSTNNSDPMYWENPPVPQEWWDGIRESMPAYNPDVTPTFGMGRIAEAFRTFPNTVRSPHPSCSFAAWGRHARYLTDEHPLDYPFGEESPLARLYELDASILLIGVGYDSNTALHLSEFRSGCYPVIPQWAAVQENGMRKWKKYTDLAESSESFPEIGREFESSHTVRQETIGLAKSRLINMRELVDFGTDYIQSKYWMQLQLIKEGLSSRK